MIDETMDISRWEQVAFCVRYCTDEFEIRERFLAFKTVSNTGSETLYNLLVKTLAELKLEPSDCMGQCYDGAANMSGHKTGLAKRFRDRVKTALYLHCWARQLNLALQHFCSEINTVRDMFATFGKLRSFPNATASFRPSKTKTRADAKYSSSCATHDGRPDHAHLTALFPSFLMWSTFSSSSRKK